MSKSIQEDTRKEIDTAAYLSNEIYDTAYFGTGKEVKNEIAVPGSNSNYTIIEKSNIGAGKFDTRELVAYAVQNNDTKEIYIVYRGTGNGKWIDNAIGLFAEKTPIQENAKKFYDRVIEKHVIGSPNPKRVIVTGHSKGGNLAQYVTMASKYGDLVDNCYSIDGQGFSKKAIENFKNIWGENYNSQIEKMYSINGQNDYVDPLGYVIIPEDRTFFVRSNENVTGDGVITQWHKLEHIMRNGGLNWDFSTDEDGRKRYNYNLERGPVGNLAQELSANMMQLSDEEFEDCAIAIMFLLEKTIGNVDEIAPGYRNTATVEEMMTFVNVGIPLIITTIKESENINGIFKLMGCSINKDHWIIEPLFDIAIELSENMTVDELEGYINLCKEISNYATDRGMNLGDLIKYIQEDPLRLIEIYASLDMGKKSLHEAIGKIFSPKNIAKLVGVFAEKHPLMAAGAVLAVTDPVVRGGVISVAGMIVAGGAIYLIANHIIVNWDSIKESIIQTGELVKNKVAEIYTSFVNEINKEINNYVASALTAVEKIITVGDGIINSVGDQWCEFMKFMKEACTVAIKTLFMFSNPILYKMASKLYNAPKEPIEINMVKLRNCVDKMNRLASRVASIDLRLDNLYYQLSRNNVEQGEGVFTSLANMYNLFRADLNVDEGQAIKKKARALTELFDGCERTDRWVANNVPQVI